MRRAVVSAEGSEIAAVNFAVMPVTAIRRREQEHR
jgi:hypothetical protein